MSHITKIKATTVLQIASLKGACEIARRLGKNWTFNENKSTFRYYNGNGTCNHEIDVGCRYSIGVNENGKVTLEWDSFSAGGLVEEVGENAQLLSDFSDAWRVEQEQQMDNFNCEFEYAIENGELVQEVVLN